MGEQNGGGKLLGARGEGILRVEVEEDERERCLKEKED